LYLSPVALYKCLSSHHNESNRGERELPLPRHHAGLPGERLLQLAQQILVRKYCSKPDGGKCLSHLCLEPDDPEMSPEAGISNAALKVFADLRKMHMKKAVAISGSNRR